MLDEQALGEYIECHFTTNLFRLETLDRYDVGAEQDDFRRYLAGQPGPTSTWPDVIRDEVARGLNTYRVRVVRAPLNEYQRYQMDWTYSANADAGEHIRVIDTSEQGLPNAVLQEDFWLIGDEHLILMSYDKNGVFCGADISATELIPRYIEARDSAWSSGVNFSKYWREHPQYHRDRSAA